MDTIPRGISPQKGGDKPMIKHLAAPKKRRKKKLKGNCCSARKRRKNGRTMQEQSAAAEAKTRAWMLAKRKK